MTDPPIRPVDTAEQAPAAANPNAPTSTDKWIKAAGALTALLGAVTTLFTKNFWLGVFVIYVVALGALFHAGRRDSPYPQYQTAIAILMGLLLFAGMIALVAYLTHPVPAQ